MQGPRGRPKIEGRTRVVCRNLWFTKQPVFSFALQVQDGIDVSVYFHSIFGWGHVPVSPNDPVSRQKSQDCQEGLIVHCVPICKEGDKLFNVGGKKR